ncbi:MAG: UDP-2,3-diacylglucosamine diphosphatase, partial [Porphyromonadaceae bacterium]|nr:UDP-2,3-diacylglucosamine diphosphatase [Porphyromonadaceae bacterium]
KRCIILGDWITYDSYAQWDGKTLCLCSIHDFE